VRAVKKFITMEEINKDALNEGVDEKNGYKEDDGLERQKGQYKYNAAGRSN
jgi:hypothetical protein